MHSTSSRNAARRSWIGASARRRGLVRPPARRRFGLALAVAAFELVSIYSPSSGAASEPGPSLDLRQALEMALAQNKQLAAFGYRVEEADGRLQQAGVLPNPQFGLLFENVAGGGFFEGFDGAETTISLAWAIEPGLRGRRVGVAETQSARVGLDAKILQLDVAAETAQRFLSCLETQAHLRNTDEAVALAERTVAAIERRVQAGRVPNAELLRARAELASERLARDDANHERSVAYHRLAAQWGETAPSFTKVDGDVLEPPAVQSFDALVARIDGNPALARLASEQRVAEARLRLAKAQRLPTVTPTLGARKLELTDDWAMVAGLNFPIPLLDRNQGRVAESRAAIARARADLEAERVRVRTTLFELYQEMQHSVHRVEVLRDEVIPRLEETLDETRSGYEMGRYRYFELRSVQADLLAARGSLVEASTAAHRLVITLERITGERVVR